MSQSAEDAECPICREAMALAGDHQIAALKCGHVFGKKCIEQWLDIKSECPECRKEANKEDVTPIFWIGGKPTDNRELTSLKEENERLKNENEEIMSSLDTGVFSDRSQHTSSQLFPTLVTEKSVDTGFRVCFSQTRIVVSTKKEAKFGIEFSLLNDLSNWSFIPLHTMQVRDMCINNSPLEVCCSIAYDSSLAFISLVNPGRRMVTTMYLTEIPWSCTWINVDTVAVGAAKGTVYIVNYRRKEILAQKSIGGPPFFSISMSNESMLLALNSQHVYFFDVDNSTFVSSPAPNKAAIIKKDASNENLFAVFSIKESKCTICDVSSQSLHPMKWCHSDEIKRLARPAITTRNKVTYIAVPKKSDYLFSLRRLDSLEQDIWEKFAGRWFIPSTAGGIMDIAFSNEGDFLLAVVSETLLSIFFLPF